jgi:hypothetical protein
MSSGARRRGERHHARTRRRFSPLPPSVDHRIAVGRRCHLHDSPAKDHSAWESISGRGEPAVAALRVGVASWPIKIAAAGYEHRRLTNRCVASVRRADNGHDVCRISIHSIHSTRCIHDGCNTGRIGSAHIAEPERLGGLRHRRRDRTAQRARKPRIGYSDGDASQIGRRRLPVRRDVHHQRRPDLDVGRGGRFFSDPEVGHDGTFLRKKQLFMQVSGQASICARVRS